MDTINHHLITASVLVIFAGVFLLFLARPPKVKPVQSMIAEDMIKEESEDHFQDYLYITGDNGIEYPSNELLRSWLDERMLAEFYLRKCNSPFPVPYFDEELIYEEATYINE